MYICMRCYIIMESLVFIEIITLYIMYIINTYLYNRNKQQYIFIIIIINEKLLRNTDTELYDSFNGNC